jgi:KDO2-lipid IV(A) lauroyltransferase
MRSPVDVLADSVLRTATCGARWVPEAAIKPIAGVLGTVWFKVLRVRRRVILENLAHAFPEKAMAERLILGQATCIHLIQTLLEFLRIPRYARLNFEGKVRIEGIEYYEAAKRRGRGVFVVSGHLGSFELSLGAAAQRFGGFSVIVKDVPKVNHLIEAIRTSTGLQIIPARESVQPLLKALQAGRTVVFALDQNSMRNKGVFVEFFGKPACTMVGLAMLALRTKAPVIGASMWRDRNGLHVIRFHQEFPLVRKGTFIETLRDLTQAYTSFLEQAIRAHPEQWVWLHKRWRTQPEEVFNRQS